MEIVQKTLPNHSFAPILNFLPHSCCPKATVHTLRMLGHTMNTSECGTHRTSAIFYALKSLISKSDPTEMRVKIIHMLIQIFNAHVSKREKVETQKVEKRAYIKTRATSPTKNIKCHYDTH